MTASSTELEQQAAASGDTSAKGWAILLVAGIFEIGYAVSVGGTKGFTNLGWSLSAVVFFFLTVFTLTLALKHLDVGVGYAVWTGIGASGAAVVSAFVFDQPLTPVRILWLAVIIAGVISIKLFSGPKYATADEAAGQ
ncbi:DMT family transporter [Actinokineospora inagensis]|uniref:DMT family transporter n=1 Tax=Actinokineospora inagensis TaxID=103730 RepID=UPI000408D704|nr:multidrug efflux SMR transporter [Actinokineospora inagensis]